MILNKTDLSISLRLLAHAVDEKPTAMKGAELINFDKGKIFSFSDVLGVSIDIDSDITGSIPYTPFAKFVNSTKENQVSITRKDNTIIALAGKTMAKFATMDNPMVDRYNRIAPTGDVWRNCPDGLLEKIKLCTVNGLESAFSGVFISGESVMAADTSVIAHAIVQGNMERIWINNTIAGKFTKMVKVSQYAISGSWLHFKNDKVTMSGRKLFDSEYPDKKIFAVEKMWKDRAEVLCQFPFPEKLITSIGTSKTFTDDNPNAETLVEILLEPDGITVTSSGSAGSFSDKIPATIDIQEPLAFNVDVTHMIGIMKKGASSVELLELNGNQMLVFIGDSWQLMVGTA